MTRFRHLVIGARRYRLRGSFLPGPLRRASVALSAMLLFGCASATKTVAGFQNRYDYRLNRYLETCQIPNPPAPCKDKQVVLNGYEKALHEAAVALKWGGPLPLQVKALKTWEKAAAK